MANLLERGRESFRRKAWGDAYTQLSAANSEKCLAPEDLERLATSAYLTGRDDESADLLARSHQEFLLHENIEGAARCAFWIGFAFLNRGELARGGGWLTRTQRLLDESRCDCVLHGYLLVPVAIRAAVEGNATTAHDTFCKVAEIADRFADRDLMMMARHGLGRSLIRMGNLAGGLALLDEVMVAITAGEVSPIMAGNIYCSVIEACHEIYDLRRAHEWTSALSHWCAAQPDLVPYRGTCLVRRAELMQLHGEWPDALKEAQRACDHLSQPPQSAMGWALYQRGELHRLRGEFSLAEEAFRQASERGRKPQPGLSLLRLAQGQMDTAVASIRNALEESSDLRTRSRMLAAYVDIMLAANDISAAQTAAQELREITAELGAGLPRAMSAYATGAVYLAKGDARAALIELRSAWTAWCNLDVPYEAARARLLMALSCRGLGDGDSANMEFDAAKHAFTQLGALPDIARVEALWKPTAPNAPGGLSAREMEVLRLLATGKTNRAIADDLFISEKTVARHVSNIFTKLDLSSRAAATAYAYEHRLL